MKFLFRYDAKNDLVLFPASETASNRCTVTSRHLMITVWRCKDQLQREKCWKIRLRWVMVHPNLKDLKKIVRKFANFHKGKISDQRTNICTVFLASASASDCACTRKNSNWTNLDQFHSIQIEIACFNFKKHVQSLWRLENRIEEKRKQKISVKHFKINSFLLIDRSFFFANTTTWSGRFRST